MSESESEDEILDRIEAALRRIADASAAVHHAAPADETPEQDAPADRAALTGRLDTIITRLRDGLGSAGPAAGLPPAPGE